MRAAMIFAQDQKQFDAWAESSGRPSRALSGAALEQALVGLAFTHPDLVAVVP